MVLDEKLAGLLSVSNTSYDILNPRFISFNRENYVENQAQTKEAFSRKWQNTDYQSDSFVTSQQHQRIWYLKLYGFKDDAALAKYLSRCDYVLDAGAGNCGKAAWFAELSPSTTVVAADISTSIYAASNNFKDLENLFFVQCDIGDLDFFLPGIFDYVSCDQVIHHTTDPYKTFCALLRVLKLERDISIYVYKKKALPRELLDDYFREYSKQFSYEQLMELSEQITELGRILSTLDQEIDFPAIPMLGIEAGKMTVQRFIYWNMMKCFWSQELGEKNSIMCNYDWYSPSQAARYSEDEFREWIRLQNLSEVHFHKECACLSGRFKKS